VACFLALLELIRLQSVAIRQSELFGDIELRRAKNFANAVAGMDHPAAEEYR
jgi:chromatin segregation and condensation protein Rec8/ScpA/Scc1 (kleisin family)